MRIGAKKTILVIDDDPDFLLLFVKMLKKIKECNVITAANGMEGVLKSKNQRFEIIFTDYNMPKLNGEEFIRTMRRGHYNQETRVVLMSSSPDKIKTGEERIDDIFSLKKPIKLSALREVLSQSPISSLGSESKFDKEFVSKLVSSFKDILRDLRGFEEIIKKETHKLNFEDAHVYNYYGCLIISSEKFNGALTIAFPENTFEEYLIENYDPSVIQGTEDIFETFVQILITKCSELLVSMDDEVYEIHSVLGIGETTIFSSRDSVLEFCTTYESTKGDFYVQVSVW